MKVRPDVIFIRRPGVKSFRGVPRAWGLRRFCSRPKACGKTCKEDIFTNNLSLTIWGFGQYLLFYLSSNSNTAASLHHTEDKAPQHLTAMCSCSHINWLQLDGEYGGCSLRIATPPLILIMKIGLNCGSCVKGNNSPNSLGRKKLNKV